MHSAIPFPRFGTEGLTQAERAQIESLIRKLKNLCEVRGLRYYTHQGVLPGGAKWTFIWNHGIHKMIVEPVARKEEEKPTGKATADVPHFFTAEVTGFRPQYNGRIPLTLTAQCRRRLEGYTGVLAPQRLWLQRFAVEYPQHLSEFMPPGGGAGIQFAQARPTWWSGRMAAVVQATMGYGRQDFDALPDEPYERAEKMALPEETVLAMRGALGLDEEGKGGAMLPACDGKPPKSGQCQFDYKARRSEGVVFASDRAPWLVRVSPSGVFGMPLPMVPATRTEAFRRYIVQVNDAEILWLLDTFGGMPSGEGFPQDEREFAAWRRAGVIIRLGQAGQFYEAADYGDAIGWSFNHAGTQAVNTCWKWGDDGLKRGQTWALTFSIGALKERGMAGAKTEADMGDAVTGVFRNIVLQYISMVEQASAAAVQEGDATQKAALYAFRRAPAADILARAIQPDVKAKDELDYWAGYTAPPIAAGWVNADLMGEGILYSHLKPKAQPQIKFPDVAMHGCISFDFSRDEDAPAPKQDPKCETVMHAYFVGDDLKVVKYCRDEREKPPGVQRDWNEGEERAVGSWTEIITYTPEKVLGAFCTSDFDERVRAAAHQKVTKTVGRDLGYGYPPAFSYIAFYDMRGTLWRYRFAQHDTTAVESKNYRMDTAILVPYFAPHSALHAWRETDSDITRTVSRSVPAFLDPNSYAYWTYDSVFAWRGGIWPGAEFTVTYRGDFVPSPYEKRKGVPVWVMGYSYDQWGSSFADNGDWIGSLPQDITHIVHPDANVWVHNSDGGRPTVKSFTRTERPGDISRGRLDISLAPQPQNVHTEMPHRWYFEISPDEWGEVFYRDAVRSEAGNVDYCNCSEVRPDGIRFSWGRNEVADSSAAHQFIGVFAQ